MKKKTYILGAVLLFLIVTALLAYVCKIDKKSIAYKVFYQDVAQEKVESATLQEDVILFKYKGDDLTYSTINPKSSSLIEYLLLHGVSVKSSPNLEKVFDYLFNFLFLALFLFMIIVTFKKFISPTSFKVVKSPVRFSQVIGMNKIKRDVMQVVEIMRHLKEYKAKGVRPPRGVILEGAPGNGKTLLARAIAGEAGLPFIASKATDFESMFMAIGPAKVKMLFSKARRVSPCIVFIDEFDGIGTKRNYSGSAIETENTRIVTALLNELDGFIKNDGILVIAATNSVKALDPALIRPGRFDIKYNIEYPTFEERIELIKLYTQNKKMQGIKEEALASLFEGFSCAKIENTLNRAALIALQDKRESFTIEDIKKAIKEG